jgi:plastocyanin
MRRRKFLEKAGLGSAAFVLPALASGATTTPRAGAQPEAESHDHQHADTSDSSATVTFGAWQSTPSFDRFVGDANDRTRNQHQLIPFISTIKAGGSVNFIISGFHNVLVYGNRTRPQDINTALIVPGSVPPLIDDPNNRVYRGLDPRALVVPLGPNATPTSVQDRVEAVHFAEPGIYLAICGVLPHFQGGMFGYIRVLRNRGRGDR